MAKATLNGTTGANTERGLWLAIESMSDSEVLAEAQALRSEITAARRERGAASSYVSRENVARISQARREGRLSELEAASKQREDRAITRLNQLQPRLNSINQRQAFSRGRRMSARYPGVSSISGRSFPAGAQIVITRNRFGQRMIALADEVANV